MKYFPNRKSQPNYKQNQRMRIQKTLNRFKNQFLDRKHFPKSGKKFQRQHQNNAARVCNRLRVLTQNQVGISYWFCEHGSLIGLVFNQSSFIWNPDKQTSILWITAGIWNRMRGHTYMKIVQYKLLYFTSFRNKLTLKILSPFQNFWIFDFQLPISWLFSFAEIGLTRPTHHILELHFANGSKFD